MKQEKKQKRVQPIKKVVEEGLSYSVEVRDKKGRVIQRISATSRSYVKWNQMLNATAKAWTQIIKDTGGTDRTVGGSALGLRVNAAIGEIVQGLRVGKGTTAVAIDDYALETPLGEGTGTDEFNHQAVTFTAPAVVGPTCSFTVKRIFVNNSGATITGIREIGAYVGMSVYFALGFRDVLPSAVYVPHGGAITVTYTIAATV